MGMAVLVYTSKDKSLSVNNSVTLESGSLYYIDYCTRKFKSKKELLESSIYNKKVSTVDDGFLKVYYIKSSTAKESLPLLINDEMPLYLKDNYFENEISEIEKARKLLFSSKNKLFMKQFLSRMIFKDTIDFNVKLSFSEYKYALKKGLDVFCIDSEYFISARSLFEVYLKNEKLGLLKPVFEESLSIWKNRIKKMDDEEIYYYSRNLRILISGYYKRIKNDKKITNLKISNNLSKVILYNYNNQKKVGITREEIATKIKQKDKIS